MPLNCLLSEDILDSFENRDSLRLLDPAQGGAAERDWHPRVQHTSIDDARLRQINAAVSRTFRFGPHKLSISQSVSQSVSQSAIESISQSMKH